MTVHVIDETGAPITNALVHASSYWRPRQLTGFTNNKGLFQYNDRVMGAISCFVEKEGWYKSGGEVWPGPRYFGDHPTNALLVVLKKKINPVPLTARHLITLIVPTTNAWVAFDFEKGDWVRPAGKGMNTDAWLMAEMRFVTRDDMDLKITIRFPDGPNGIQEFWARESYEIPMASELMPPQEIPEAGFINSIVVFKKIIPGRPNETSCTKDRNYLYRIRAITNEFGKVVQANVGWIRRDFQIGLTADGCMGLTFNYYYNPDPHSRSLESNAAL